MDAILSLIYSIVIVWFVLTYGAIIGFLVRYRRRPGHQATYVTGNTLRQYGWVLVLGLIVLLIDIGSYVVFRVAHPEWAAAAAHLSVLVASLNTMVLLSSSLTMVLAFAAADQHYLRAARQWLGCTVLAWCFCSSKRWNGPAR